MKNSRTKIILGAHDVRLDAEYAQWIAEIKHRYRSARIKAAVRVNGEKLLFNWEVGRDLVQKKAEERWGSGVVEQVSLDLRREFPDAEGFSASNLWYMKRWYLFYENKTTPQILQRIVEELQVSLAPISRNLQHPVEETANCSESGVVGLYFPMLFALIPWGQHIEIVSNCKSLDEAFFLCKRNY